MSRDHTPRSRRSLIALSLTAALLLTAWLGWEAVTAARAQRDAVEGVLRDYATLAAEQYARNVNVTFDYEWFLPVLRLAVSPEGFGAIPTVRPPQGADRSAEQWQAEPLDPGLEVAGQRDRYRLENLAVALFAIDPSGVVVVRPVEGQTVGDLSGLAERVNAHRSRFWQDGWTSAAFLEGDASRLVVYRVAPEDAAYPVVGFITDRGTLGTRLAYAVTIYDLLPATLTAGAGDARDDLVLITVEDDAGNSLFRLGDGRPAASTSFDLGPQRADIEVTAAIPATSAEHLIVGGLPYSRVPLIGTLLLLTLGVFAYSLVLWRREQELVDMREQFIAGASHELRTPLAQIRMFAETLRLERVRSDEERVRSLEIIDREARRLSLLVDNLLQFSRPGPSASHFAPERVDLWQLVDEVVDGFSPVAAAAGVTIVTNIGGDTSDRPSDRAETSTPPSPRVAADRDMLRQVLLNLLDNAVKYGPAEQTVTVELAWIDGAAQISISDAGPGIPADERELVWQRFERGTHSNGITGTGIGLALVRELVALHRGEVEVTDAPGGGARFIVRLPAEDS